MASLPERRHGMSAISVVLADDELLLREAIMTLLCLNDDIEVVGTAQDWK